MPTRLPDRNAEQLVRFAEAVVGDAAAPMVVVDDDLTILAASPGFCQLQTEPTPLEGRELLLLDEGRWDVPGLRRALEDVLPQRHSFDDAEVTDAGGRTWFVSGRVLPTGERAELIILTFQRTTVAERTASHLQNEDEAEETGLADEILATVREPMLVLDLDGRVKKANVAFYRLFRVSRDEVIGRPLRDLGNGQWDIPALQRQLDAVLQREYAFEDFEVEHEFQAIGQRIMLLNARRIDHLRLVLLGIDDVTERRRLERQQRTVQAELAHRLKNVLAVVQSIAIQTRAETVDAFRSALVGRIKALALAHGALIEAQWRQTDLRVLVGLVLAPHIGRDGGERVKLDGPSVGLAAEHASAFALIIHELATNSAKYGALSNSSGNVSVTWSLVSHHLHLEWSELGGPPVTATPTTGFGTTLIQRTAEYQFGGQAELLFEPQGFHCHLDLPLAR